MNNKLLARIVAVASCVTMLGTVAFAADPTITIGETNATLSFMDGETDITISEESQITMMAYLVGSDVATVDAIPAYSDQEVIALDQVDGATGFGDVLVAAEKLTDAEKIAVIVGGSDGDTDKYLIALESTPAGKTVTFMNGDTATPVVAADGKVTLPTAAETTFWGTPLSGLNFTLYSWVALDAEGNVTAEYKLSEVTELTEIAEDVTLYAKYDTGYKVGDINLDGSVAAIDTTLIGLKTARSTSNALNANVDKAIYEGSVTKVGDINLDGSVAAIDTTLLGLKTARSTSNALNANIGKKVYVIKGQDDIVAD